MKIYEEFISLKEHTPWSGAKYWHDEICKYGLDEEFMEYLAGIYDELTPTELNDILWFEDEFIIAFLEICEIPEKDLKEYREYFELEDM